MSLAALASFQVSLANTANQWLCMPQAQKHVIKNVNVFDGVQMASFKRVVISGGMIVPDEDTDGATTEDGNGAYLVPGFFDAHAHVYGEAAITAMRDYGVTTALDMGTFPYQENIASLRSMSEKGYTAVYGSGAAATSNGSSLSHIPHFPSSSYVTCPTEAVAFVNARVKEGVDYIKIFINETAPPDKNSQIVIVGSAKSAGLRVVSHATSDFAYSEAVNANGKFITHAPKEKVLTSRNIKRMLSNEQVSIPTLIKMKILLDAQNQPQNYTNSKGSVKAMYDANVPILVGTDCDDERPFVKYEGSLQAEMQLLVAAGMTEIDVLKGATSLPAKYFNLTDRGVIAVGKRADMVLLDGNPLSNISKTGEIVKVWINGIPNDLSSS